MSKYIKIEDAQKILESNIGCDDGIHDTIGISAIEKLNSLPSIDFEEMINDVDELHKKQYKDEDTYDDHGKGWVIGFRIAIESIRNKLPK